MGGHGKGRRRAALAGAQAPVAQHRLGGRVRPQRAAAIYVDGKKVATVAAHRLDRIELEVHSRQPPRQIHISGASGPDDPPPTSWFSVTELPP